MPIFLLCPLSAVCSFHYLSMFLGTQSKFFPRLFQHLGTMVMSWWMLYLRTGPFHRERKLQSSVDWSSIPLLLFFFNYETSSFNGKHPQKKMSGSMPGDVLSPIMGKEDVAPHETLTAACILLMKKVQRKTCMWLFRAVILQVSPGQQHQYHLRIF